MVRITGKELYMRLINADKVKKLLKAQYEGAEYIENDINKIPTSYDVKKVLERLEETKCSEEDANTDIDCHMRNAHIQMCIDIVKGGLEE
jgi:hypothetical protein